MFVIILSALVSLAAAQVPVWYPGGPCGVSKYADAGTMPLPPFRKIVGGQEARPHEFPWQASIRRKSTDSHFCGGSIINQRWIITAAHCMQGEQPGQVSVVIGDHTRNQPNANRVSLDVSRIVVHPDYSGATFTNDISLIEVVQTISFSPDVQPVCGPDQSNLYEYRFSHCAGWGTLSSGGACCPQTLQYVTLNITTNAFCDSEYPAGSPILPDMICASDNTGGNQRDSCQGDSGGPLTVADANNVFSLVGLVSWGIGCASGYPGVYARVTTHHQWILSTIGA